MFYSSLLFIVISVSTCSTVFSSDYDEIIQLQQEVLQNYSKNLIPLQNSSSSIRLSISFAVKTFRGLDTVAGILSTIIGLKVIWNDGRLTWQRQQKKHLNTLDIQANKIWMPTIMIKNAASERYTLRYGNEKRLRLSLTNNGEVTLNSGFIFTTTCDVDMMDYPRDTHTCRILILTPYLPPLLTMQPNLETGTLAENSEWEILNSDIKMMRNRRTETINLSFVLRRRSNMAVISTIAPILLLAVMNLFVFLIPIESGERVGYSVSLLLSLVVFFIIVSDRMPQGTLSVPHLFVYLIVLLVCSSLITLSNIVVIGWYKNGPSPSCMKIGHILQKVKDCCRRLRRQERDDNKMMSHVEVCYVADLILLIIFTLFLTILTLVRLLPLFLE